MAKLKSNFIREKGTSRGHYRFRGFKAVIVAAVMTMVLGIATTTRAQHEVSPDHFDSEGVQYDIARPVARKSSSRGTKAVSRRAKQTASMHRGGQGRGQK